MSSFPKAENIKIEHNNTFSDHDYYYKESAIEEMDEENRSFFVDVENEHENDGYNARGRKRRNVKQPDFFMINNNSTSSNGKASKARPRKSVNKKRRSEKVKYEVEYIWGKRPDNGRPGKVEYRVYWKGYPIEQSSWEPEDNLRLCQESIDRYEQREMYFNDKGEKEMRSNGLKKDAAENGVKVVVVNGAKPLKQILPTMQARHVSTSSSSVSIPSLPKSHKKAGKASQPTKVKVIRERTSSLSPQSLSDAQLVGVKKRKMSASSLGNASSGKFQIITNGNNKIESNVEATAKTLEELAAKLQAKTVDKILSHESSNIDGVPFIFLVRYGNGTEKRVIMRDLLDIAPRALAVYLASALEEVEKERSE